MSLNFLPLVSVVVLNWNGLEDTKICLEYIKKQTYKNIEIIVVDNGSNDGSVQYLKTLNDIKLVVNEKNKGFTGGHIVGLSYAQGEFILLLNNDAVMEPDLVKRALKNFDDERVAVVGGKAYRWNEENPLLDERNEFYSYQRIDSISAEAIFYNGDYGVPEEVNNVSGSCVMVRRSIIDQVGYLEDRFFAYYEESDLFARIKRAGYKIIYDPRVEIWHKIGASSERKSSSFMYYMLFRNRFFFAIRNFQNKFLGRFLLHYTKFAIKSLLKIVLSRGDPVINRSFTKAFFYNLIHAPRSFHERQKLKRKLGESRYNSQILLEQSNVSHVVSANSKTEILNIIKASTKLRPSHEVIIISDSSIVDSVSETLPHNIRLVSNVGYFDTHNENYGIITSRYEWVQITDIETFCSPLYTDRSDLELTKLLLQNKSCTVVGFSDYNPSFTPTILTRREILINAHGMRKGLSKQESLAFIVLFSEKIKEFFDNRDLKIIDLFGLSSSQYHSLMDRVNYHYAYLHNKPSRFSRYIFSRSYRLQQLRNLVLWLLSPKIKIRLKLARLKNILVFTLKLKRRLLAIELKHIQNEIIRTRHDYGNSLSAKKTASRAYKYQSKHPLATTVYIICRDRLTPLLKLVRWLEKAGFSRIVFIDNDSAFPPLLTYLKKTKYQVLDMRRNAGHTVAWQQAIIPMLTPDEYYILTDPDVIPTCNGKELIDALFKTSKKFPEYLKIGLGLKIDDLPDHFSLKDSVISWEEQFWKKPIEKNVYEAGVDTTFALYKPFTYAYTLHPSIRLGSPFLARHLPWYTNDSEPPIEEESFYRARLDKAVNSWNTGQLPERYRKELTKKGRRR